MSPSSASAQPAPRQSAFEHDSDLNQETIQSPRHVAIIMDGNGRWARKRDLPRVAGHEAGSKSIGQCIDAALESGVEVLTFYAFSSENWKRPQPEVDALMSLLVRFLDDRAEEMMQKNVRLRAIGRTNELPASARACLDRAHEKSASNSALTVLLALNYGGRQEICDAVRAIVSEAVSGNLLQEQITPETIASHLYTAGYPDPDLLIRTSGELRLSNFLLWQLSYTELYVTEKLWPDFQKKDFFEALDQYKKRQRRFGGV